ncbi:MULTISPECIES: threonine synthase [unclassified Paracoccus (in: a-proteobacteria)]|uniref:threonine synthase n=1 Tax=unclassified Paracoccus (in: a-proteobacteria) TaxID=2688777 RepID=UPI0012B382A3|nr:MULTISPECIES: threonine synthase [unclassified Paracoccus (in: a-proteobacteria)]UXU74028.1 threonine synthase [Paracoccus sp. SMMA_5]UXU79916.1 threonine synthase [Paracoccus sp. SMMA_5_TC]
MRYVSTRGRAPVLGFEQAMMTGLARDGGLYLPETLPRFTVSDIARLDGLPYEEVALRVIQPFVGDSFSEAELAGAIQRAYAGFDHVARAPLRQLAPGQHLLELFHGPTLAFKDFAMQLIGQLFQLALARSGQRVTILGATSGDTGSAAIEAFRGLDNVDVFIMYPHDRVSEVQRRQMTTPADSNVHALAVDGTFDDCQARLKDLFNDHDFRDRVGLAGVNSINWARVLAQIVYYFSAAATLGAPLRPVDFSVPTGNFGDVLAGALARSMGLPVGKLWVATNHNDILYHALTEGEYRIGAVRPSISPSMDIQVSSNFERAIWLACGKDGDEVTRLMEELKTGGFSIRAGILHGLMATYCPGRASEQETLDTIATVFRETGTVICPHSAVGVKVAREQKRPEVPMVTLATAHPAKFPDAVERAIGQRPALPAHMADLFDRPERITRIDNDADAIRALILERRTA